MRNQRRHIHRYKRKKYPTGNAIYFCTLPDCHHKIECQLALGKRSLCNLCGNEFIMTEYHVKLHLPHCNNCGKVKVKGSDGQNHYIRKSTVSLIAADGVSNLRDRLEQVTTVEADKDI
jgi:hypothetical protein